MGGGLMQLVAYGAQDVYLTGNPQITFFKVVYRRHTNFSMETIQQTIDGTSQLSETATTSGTVTISRNGDLISKIYVRCDQDGTDGISGDSLIDNVILEIGGQQIDKHTKEWLQIWAELTTNESKATGYKYLTGGFSNTLMTGAETSQQSIMVPLQFWFCRNPGLSLPLIALQYHEVKLRFTWGSGAAASGISRKANAAVTPTVEVWCDYIYLDTDERRRFAQVSHEYLIEQLQYNAEGSAKSAYNINLNHPVKELIWTNDTDDITTQKARLTLNGHDRFAAQTREYFQIKQPLDHHTSVPGYNIKETEYATMLSQHLPVGNATLNGYNTYASGADEIVAGVVNIATAAGTNPVVGDIIKVIEKSVVMLATPLSIGTADLDTPNGYVNGLVDIDTGTVTLAANTGETPVVGDLVVIDVSSHVDASAQAGPTVTTVATVASATSFTFSGNDVAVAADFHMHIIGRLSNVEVGTGVVTAVDTAGTDFTLSNNDIVTKQDFKMHIIGRTQNPLSRCSQLARDVNVYSFALKPEEHQPSGTCNFSRIDNAELIFDGTVTVQNIYAVNYNVLRIMSGMGGLAYSN